MELGPGRRRRLCPTARSPGPSPSSPGFPRWPPWQEANYASVIVNGRLVPAVALDQLDDSVFPTLLDGRAPQSGSEISLGASTLRLAGASVGGIVDVQVGDVREGCRCRDGRSFPTSSAAASPPPTWASVPPRPRNCCTPRGFPPSVTYNFFLIRYASGTPRAAATAAVRQALAPMCAGGACSFFPDRRPNEVNAYGQVKWTPLLLAGGARIAGGRRSRQRPCLLRPAPPARPRCAQDARFHPWASVDGSDVAGHRPCGRGPARWSADRRGGRAPAVERICPPARSGLGRTDAARGASSSPSPSRSSSGTSWPRYRHGPRVGSSPAAYFGRSDLRRRCPDRLARRGCVAVGSARGVRSARPEERRPAVRRAARAVGSRGSA